MRPFAIIAVVILETLPVAAALAAERPASSNRAEVTRAQGPSNTGEPVAIPQPSALAVQYNRSGDLLWVVSQVVALAIPAIVLFTGLSARLRTWSERIGRRWFFTLCVYLLLYSVIDYLLRFPLDFYADYLRQHAYGVSNQSLGHWLGDTLKQLAIGVVVGCLLLWIPYLLLDKSPRRWWIYTGLAAVPVVILAQLVSPIWIDPLFNQFGPLKDRQLESQILKLARRAGIEGGRVYEVDKSRDTKFVDAYVKGFLGTKRIVLWDTLLTKLGKPEIMFVMGHEMGHYVLGHLWKGIVLACLGIFLALGAVYWVAGAFLRRFGKRIGFDRLSDIASLPLVILLVQLASLAMAPPALAISRYMEHEADRFGLELTQDNHAAAMGFVELQQENLGVPRHGWLRTVWRDSHPSIAERIEFANRYRPWQEGKPLRYGALFRPGS